MLERMTRPIIPRTREAVLFYAVSQVGVIEDPPGSNLQKYGKDFGWNGVPWCMEFVWCCFYAAGFNLKKTASCTTLATAYKHSKQWVTSGYKPGDIIMFDFSKKRKITEHVGICYKVGKGYLLTIEGNTGPKNNANGGMVMLRRRELNVITGACRPGYNM